MLLRILLRKKVISMASVWLFLSLLLTVEANSTVNPHKSQTTNISTKKLPVQCENAESTWTAAQMIDCAGPIIHCQTTCPIDMSSFTSDDLTDIFEIEEKMVKASQFTINNNSFKSLELKLEIPDIQDVTITISNNRNLEWLELDIINPLNKYFTLMIKGNPKLDQSSLDAIHMKYNKSDGILQIQKYKECYLDNSPIKGSDLRSKLNGCLIVTGDLEIEGGTPEDFESISPLNSIEGCFTLRKTQITSMAELPFLTKQTKLPYKCNNGTHTITENPKFCFPPELRSNLSREFNIDFTDSNGKNCVEGCSNSYLWEKRDPDCKVIMDDLIIQNVHSPYELRFMQSITEIHGYLIISNTNLEKFYALPNLEKLNSNGNIDPGIITLQSNPRLQELVFPKLKRAGIRLAEDQLLILDDLNPNFELSSALADQLGISVKSDKQVNAAKEEESLFWIYDLIFIGGVLIVGLILCGCGLLIYFVFVKRIFFGVKKSYWQAIKSVKSKYNPVPIEAIDQHPDLKAIDAEFNGFKLLLEKYNKKDDENMDTKEITFQNHEYIGMTFDTPKFKHDYTLTKTRAPASKPAEGMHLEIYPKKLDPTKFLQYWQALGIQPIYPEKFLNTAKRMMNRPAYEIAGEVEFRFKKNIEIKEFGIDFSKYVPRCEAEAATIKPLTKPGGHIPTSYPQYEIYRYRESLNLKSTTQVIKFMQCPDKNRKSDQSLKQNGDEFVSRMVKFLLDLPVGQCANFSYSDVIYFFELMFPLLDAGSSSRMKKFKEESRGVLPFHPHFRHDYREYVYDCTKRQARIVGELRGNFQALKKVLSLPSNVPHDETKSEEILPKHPIEDYAWIFLGNFTSDHPQSLETIMLLLGLQYTLGRERIILVRGPLEFKDYSRKYGFRSCLTKRFGSIYGKNLWKAFLDVFDLMPLSCRLLYSIQCSYGGLAEWDLSLKKTIESYKERDKTQDMKPDSMAWKKLFAMPNYTVLEGYDNLDTRGGYYFGERMMRRARMASHYTTHFTTIPLESGLGFFGECDRSFLYAISSVKGLRGHAAQETKVAVVAEIIFSEKKERVIFNVILDEDQVISFDEHEEIFTSTVEQRPNGTRPAKLANQVVYEPMGVLKVPLPRERLEEKRKKRLANNNPTDLLTTNQNQEKEKKKADQEEDQE